MSRMSVRVEFLTATGIENAIREAKNKALIWDVAYVCFKFNDTDVSVGCHCDVTAAAEVWINGYAEGHKNFIFDARNTSY